MGDPRVKLNASTPSMAVCPGLPGLFYSGGIHFNPPAAFSSPGSSNSAYSAQWSDSDSQGSPCSNWAWRKVNPLKYTRSSGNRGLFDGKLFTGRPYCSQNASFRSRFKKRRCNRWCQSLKSPAMISASSPLTRSFYCSSSRLSCRRLSQANNPI